MFQIAIAHSLVADPKAAVQTLANAIQDQLAGHPPQAALLLIGAGLDPRALITQCVARFPAIPLISGLTQGEVSRQNGYRYGSALLIAFASDSIGVETTCWPDPSTSGASLAPAETAAAPARLLLLLSDARADHNALHRAATARYPAARLFGLGLAASNNQDAPLFHQDQPQAGGALGLVLRGPLRFAWGLANGLNAGWQALGQPMTAEIEGTRILALDGQPAAARLRQLHPAWPHDNPLQPLALQPPGADAPARLHPIAGTEATTGALRLAEPLAPGSKLQPTEPDPNAIKAAARDAMGQALDHLPSLAQPAAALWFSTRLRALALDAHPAAEYQALSPVPYPSLPLAGGYAERLLVTTTAAELEQSPYGQLALLLGEEASPSDPPAQHRLRHSRLQRLQAENQRLRAELDRANQRLARGEHQRQQDATLARITSNARTEQHYLHRALALDALCHLLEQNHADLRRHALIGDPPRLNRSGLARLIRREHQARTGEEFPLKENALGRLFGGNRGASD
jgi:hypothetical protein